MDDDKRLPDATPDRDYDTVAELPRGLLPADRPKVPSVMPPLGSCDAHVHMPGGPGYAMSSGAVEALADDRSFDDWIALFRTHLDTLGLNRAVIVQSILYGSDNSVTLAALRALGDTARGIGLLRDGSPERSLDDLAQGGIRGLRLNYIHGGILTWDGAQAMAPALAARDMHLQMLVSAEDHLADLADGIRALPCPVVLDHMAWPDIAAGPDAPTFARLCDLLASGDVWVKLSGLYRVADAPWDATDAFVARLVAANPERCLWGSDWPHIMLNGAQMPDAGALLDAFMRVVTDEATRQRILVDNPATVYGF